jgi:hypothetical protein
MSACPHIVTVDTNTPGYSLSFKALSSNTDSNLVHTSIPGKTIAATNNNGSPTTPAALDPNSWGFALPKAASTNNTSVNYQTITKAGYGAFDDSYDQRSNAPYTTTTDKYAAVPTTDTELNT